MIATKSGHNGGSGEIAPQTTPEREYDYVYLPGGCEDCPGSGFADPIESRSADQLRYQLSYAEDQFTLTDSEGGVWRYVGFRPDRAERGRFRSFQSGTVSVEVTGYTSYGHISGISLSDGQVKTGKFSGKNGLVLFGGFCSIIVVLWCRLAPGSTKDRVMLPGGKHVDQ